MTAPQDPWEDGKGFEGRHLRSIVGAVLMLGALGLAGFQIVTAVKAGQAVTLSKELLILYGVVFGAGLLLFDRASFKEVADRIPLSRRDP